MYQILFYLNKKAEIRKTDSEDNLHNVANSAAY